MGSKPPCPDASRFRAMLLGTLAENEQTVLAEHVEDCSACRELLEAMVRQTEIPLDADEE